MIAEIKEIIPNKTFEAQRNTTPKIFYSRIEKDYNRIRIRGIPESEAQSGREKYEDDLGELKKIFQHLNVEAPVDAVTRHQKPQGDKTLGMVVKIPNEHYRKLIMLSVGKLKTYEILVGIGRELRPEEQAKQNQLLLQLKKMINSGIDKKTLLLRNARLEKLVDNKWIEFKAKPE